MPAIGDLKRLGSTFPDGCCVFGGTVSAHDFHRRMVLKPGRDGFYRPIRQHIDGFATFQIANQRPVTQSALVWSGKRAMLPPLPPLRTVRVDFSTHSSSLSLRPCHRTRLLHV